MSSLTMRWEDELRRKKIVAMRDRVQQLVFNEVHHSALRDPPTEVMVDDATRWASSLRYWMPNAVRRALNE